MAIERDERLAGSDPARGELSLSMGEKTPSPLGRLTVRIVPDEVDMALHPRPASASAEPPGAMWHRVRPRPGALVSLTSFDDRLRIIRLSVQSDAPGWNARWARWVYAVRSAPELLGGDALSAQDVLADDDSSLTLLVLPGEKREATLEFDALLDRETEPGDYRFDVVATDTGEGARDTAAALLRLRHPAATLLNHLPHIYRESLSRSDETPLAYQEPSFFERFLRGFEDAMAPTQERLANLDRYFGTRTTPSGFLPWLATWVGLVLDENWPQLRRRRLIREAAELYRWRGTRRGLSRYLEIYAGVEPEINDQPFVGMHLGPGALLGRGTVLGNVPPHTFVVTVAVPHSAKLNEQIVRDIIESEKPAYTAYALRIVRRAADDAPRS